MTQLGTTKIPVHVPADVNGMKIRFAGGQWAKFWKACDAVPIKLTQGEVYEALMRGTADATQSYFFILEAYKHWDVIKYYSVINAGELCSYGLAINQDRWKSFPPEIQKVFEAVSDEFVDKYAQGLIGVRGKVIPLAEKKGMKFINLTGAERAKWLEKAKPFMEAWVKSMDERGLPGKETQDTFLKLVEKVQKAGGEPRVPLGKEIDRLSSGKGGTVMTAQNHVSGPGRLLDRFISILTGVAVGLLVPMMFLVTGDVIGRYIFNSPIPAVFEINSHFLMVMVVFFPLAYVHHKKEHVLCEPLYRRPSLRRKGVSGRDFGHSGAYALCPDRMVRTPEGDYVHPSSGVHPGNCGCARLAQQMDHPHRVCGILHGAFPGCL